MTFNLLSLLKIFSKSLDNLMFTFSQVELACRVQKPLLVHDRDAHESVIEVLEKYKTTLPSVVIHCFTGGADEVKAYISRGYYIGITGYLCKGKWKHLNFPTEVQP